MLFTIFLLAAYIYCEYDLRWHLTPLNTLLDEKVFFSFCSSDLLHFGPFKIEIVLYNSCRCRRRATWFRVNAWIQFITRICGLQFRAQVFNFFARCFGRTRVCLCAWRASLRIRPMVCCVVFLSVPLMSWLYLSYLRASIRSYHMGWLPTPWTQILMSEKRINNFNFFICIGCTCC